jgi:uncharacterized FlaG/YvyC family protein
MKAATLNEIKKELNTLEPDRVIELCMRLAKYKKESKELLTYLLFESYNETAYIENVKADINELFGQLSKENLYFVKKSLRKILRMVNRQVRYSGNRQTEVTLRIYFCAQVKKFVPNLHRSQLLVNLFEQQVKKIKAALDTLPEDLQFDYQQEFGELK